MIIADNSGQMTAVPRKILVNGSLIKNRLVQQLFWGSGAATAGAYAIAAIYYLLLEVRYNFDVTLFGHHLFTIHEWLKQGWDGLISKPWWDASRHDIRDVYEGVLASIGVKSLMANWKKHPFQRVHPALVVTSPLVIFLAAAIPVIGGVWLLNIGGPAIWHHLFHHYVVKAAVSFPHAWSWLSTFLSTYNWQPFLIGLVTGQLVHRLFAPIGNTIQLYFVGRAVDKARDTGKIPFWASHPVAPPTLRERFSWIMDTHAEVPDSGKAASVMIAVFTAITFLLVVYGGFVRLWLSKHGLPGNLF